MMIMRPSHKQHVGLSPDDVSRGLKLSKSLSCVASLDSSQPLSSYHIDALASRQSPDTKDICRDNSTTVCIFGWSANIKRSMMLVSRICCDCRWSCCRGYPSGGTCPSQGTSKDSNVSALKAAEELRAEKAGHCESNEKMTKMAIELKDAVDRYELLEKESQAKVADLKKALDAAKETRSEIRAAREELRRAGEIAAGSPYLLRMKFLDPKYAPLDRL